MGGHEEHVGNRSLMRLSMRWLFQEALGGPFESFSYFLRQIGESQRP